MPTFASVSFFCPGTTEKPAHACTRESLASLTYVLDAPFDQIATGGGAESLDTGPAPDPVDYQPLLDRLQAKIGGEPLRVQVKCRICDSVNILTRHLIDEPEPLEGSQVGAIWLMPPTPADEALVDAAKNVSGAETIKTSMANGVFVLANVALITTLVTTLGLSKQEEIGSKITGGAPAVFLLLAVALGALSIILALGAIMVRVHNVRLGNLEAVRTAVVNDVSERATLSGISLSFLGGAVFCVAVAFGIVMVQKLTRDDAKPTGSLSVTISSATLDAAIETSWSKAPKDSELQLQVDGASPLNVTKDTSDGSAEIKTSVRLQRDPTASTRVTFTSKLAKGGAAVSGATKQQCYNVPATGSVQKVDC